MKHRLQPLPDRDAQAGLEALAAVLAGLRRPEDVRAFLEDLCTPAELEAMADRWKVVPLLVQGVPYREIHDRTLVSVTTIGRVARTIELILEKTGHNISLARVGPDSWEIRQGSAKISITYDERNGGLISADAWLAELPKENAAPIYSYLLRENYGLKNLTLSVDEQDIVLSLLIFDRYLNEETGLQMFTEMFEKADFYDDILVKEFGAKWKKQD